MVRIVLLLAAAIVAALLLLRWLARTEPAKIARAVRWGGATLGVAGVLLLAVSGRLQALILSLGALLPLVGRAMALWQRARASAGPTPGRQSQVQTEWLRVWLDHGSGAMDGEVLQGRHRGRRLQDLGLAQLLDVLGECRSRDPQAASLLEAYLDRVHGDAWRAGAEDRAGSAENGAPHGAAMSRAEAYQILGLQPGAGPDQIREAHRRLMQKLHPDRGGSTYLAAQINRAKEVLLG
jgi:hypothetical protein